MSEHTKFKWLLANGEARKGGRLIQDAEHEIETYGAAVVAEWVRTGAAEYVGPKAKKAKE